MSTWIKLQTEKLIKLHMEYPNLYNCKDVQYKNWARRTESLEEIAQNMQCCRPGTSSKDVKLKLKTLRRQYLKEKSAMQQFQKSGCGIEDVYTPKLWCYNELQYLGDFNDDIDGESNISYLSEKVQTECFNGNCYEMQSPSPSSINPSVISSVAQPNVILTSEMPMLTETSSKKESPLRPFLNNLEMELRELNSDLLADAEWRITNLIHGLQKKQRIINAGYRVLPTTSSVTSTVSEDTIKLCIKPLKDLV